MEETQEYSNKINPERENSVIAEIVKKIAFILMLIFAFLTPLLFNPTTMSNVFDFPKWFLISAIALLLMVLTGVYTIVNEKIILPSKKAGIVTAIFAVGVLVSFFMSSTNWRSLVFGKAGLLIALMIIFLTSLVLLRDKIEWLIYTILASSVVASLIQVLAFLEILPKILNFAVFESRTFSTFGSQLALGTFLLVCLAMTLVFAFSTGEGAKKIFLFVLAGVQSLALVFAVAQILPGQAASPKFLPFTNGWSIAVDQLKTGKTAFFGVGPDNFGPAFRKLRDVNLNAGEDWFVSYNSSSNEWLGMATTTGLVGLVGLVLLVLLFVKSGLSEKENVVAKAGLVGILVLVGLFTLIPANLAMLFLLFSLGIVVVVLAEREVSTFDFTEIPAVRVIFYVITALVFLALPGFLGFNLGRTALAEMNFGRSLQYAMENRGTDTYNAQIKAIELNPYSVAYRTSYANTCLALANALANKEGELTDDERTTITQLVSQAIREAKAAATLDPENADSWVNLANVYRQLINFAEGADQWTLASYVQAIRLDSTNPQLRLDLGGILYSLGYYDDAIDQFKQAVSLKQDYANAYYNLSYAYRQKEMYDFAYGAMQNVSALIDVNSSDYEKVLSELKDLYALLPDDMKQATPSASTGADSQLREPEPVGTPVPNPVEFDENTQGELAPEVNGQPVQSGFEGLVNQEENQTTPTEE